MRQVSKGIWEQMNEESYKHIYNKSEFTLDKLKEVLDEYYNPNNPKRIHKKNLEIIKQNNGGGL